jgi:hypothetical protein
MAAFNLAGLAADLKDYTKDHKDYFVENVTTAGMQGKEGTSVVPIESYVKTLPVDGDERVIMRAKGTDPLQPGQKGAFTPTSGFLGLNDERLVVKPVKIDLLITEAEAQDIFDTYTAKLKKQTFNPQEVPLEMYMMREIEQRASEKLRIALFKAVLNPSGTGSLDLFDGFCKKISLDLLETTPKVNAVTLAARSASNAVAELEKFYDAIGSEFESEEMVLIVNKADKVFYNKAYRTAFGALPYNTEFKKMTLDGTSIELVVEPGLAGSTLGNRPILTTKNNFHFGYSSDFKNISLDFDYNVRSRDLAIVADLKLGVAIADKGQVWVGTN